MAKKQSYVAQINSPQWQRKRLDVFNERGFKCEKCGNDKEQLNVHHKEYQKGKLIWEYPNSELMVLCKSCHTKIHDEQKGDKVALTFAERYLIERIRIINKFDEDTLYQLTVFLDECIRKYPKTNIISNLFYADLFGYFEKIVSDLDFYMGKQKEYDELVESSREIEDALGDALDEIKKLKEKGNG